MSPLELPARGMRLEQVLDFCCRAKSIRIQLQLQARDSPVPGFGKVEEEVGEKGDVKSKEKESRLGTPVPPVDVEHVGLQLVHDDTTSNVTGTSNDHTLSSDSGRRCFRNDGICWSSVDVVAVLSGE